MAFIMKARVVGLAVVRSGEMSVARKWHSMNKCTVVAVNVIPVSSVLIEKVIIRQEIILILWTRKFVTFYTKASQEYLQSPSDH